MRNKNFIIDMDFLIKYLGEMFHMKQFNYIFTFCK